MKNMLFGWKTNTSKENKVSDWPFGQTFICLHLVCIICQIVVEIRDTESLSGRGVGAVRI